MEKKIIRKLNQKIVDWYKSNQGYHKYPKPTDQYDKAEERLNLLKSMRDGFLDKVITALHTGELSYDNYNLSISIDIGGRVCLWSPKHKEWEKNRLKNPEPSKQEIFNEYVQEIDQRIKEQQELVDFLHKTEFQSEF